MALTAVAVATGGVMADEMPKGLWAHPHPLVHHTNRVGRTAGRRLLKAAPALSARYDLRDVDGKGTTYLTPIRDQSPYGTCWAFASMVGIEYLMNRDEGIAADLSVNNLVNLHGFAAAYDQGGLPDLAVAVFLREDGPVTTALDPYKRPGMSVRIEESFARGLDPDNETETNLLATISFDAVGKPVVGVSPENSALWTYTVLGSRNLLDWSVRSETDRFFRVKVTPK